jgi:hypothetical protein
MVVDALAHPDFVLARDYTSPEYESLCGLTTYLMKPSSGRVVSPYYAEIDYDQFTHWGNMLATYYASIPKRH